MLFVKYVFVVEEYFIVVSNKNFMFYVINILDLV